MNQYLDLLRDILENGESHEDRTGVGTLSVFGRQLRFNLSDGFPLLTTKKLSFRYIVEELLWFLDGSTNNDSLKEKGVTIWNEWATKDKCQTFGRKEGDLGPIYGHQWRNFGAEKRPNGYWHPEEYYSEENKRVVNPSYFDNGFDQIKYLIEQIKTNPNSRRLIVSGWNPWEQDSVALPPCHTLFQFKVIKEKILSCQLYQRSADVFLGVPFNIASYALLTHLIAHVVGLEVGEFVHTFGDVHIYNNHKDQVAEQLGRNPKKLPRILINDKFRNSGLNGLMSLQYEDVILDGYEAWPSIKAPVAV